MPDRIEDRVAARPLPDEERARLETEPLESAVIYWLACRDTEARLRGDHDAVLAKFRAVDAIVARRFAAEGPPPNLALQYPRLNRVVWLSDQGILCAVQYVPAWAPTGGDPVVAPRPPDAGGGRP